MSRVLTAVLPLALALSLLAAPASTPVPEPEQVAEFTAASLDTGYSDPDWFPLRNVSKMACVYTNGCVGKPQYPALDLVGAKGDPVYAAGKGILRMGESGKTCFNGDQTSTRGNWVWVDHGGGVVSKYQHLGVINTALIGKHVNPSDMIGRMGQSGSKCGGPYYIHFETRRGGVSGTPYPYYPGTMRICSPDLTYYPRALGYSAWDDVPRDTIIKGGSHACLTDPVSPSRPSSTRTARGSSWAVLRWPEAGPSVDSIAIQRQEFQVAANRWGLDTYRYTGGRATETVWKDVRSMRKYRARVAYHNAAGHSLWTPWMELVGPPNIPTFREISATSSRVIYRWNKPLHNGAEVTGYTVAIRPKISGTWRAWSYKFVRVGSTSTDWTGLPRGRTYGVKVRATSSAGPSAYNGIRTVTTG